MTVRRVSLAAGVACAAVLAGASPVAAASGTYTVDSLTEPASPGLAVAAPLAEFDVVSKARIVVPASWKRIASPAGTLNFRSRDDPGCTYAISFSVRSALVTTQPTASFVASALPSPDPRRLLDSGERGSSAFRVVRPVSTAGGIVHLSGLWATVLTRRTDIVPRGKVAWTELAVSATSLPDQDCGSGTYRDVLGPALGDVLATARTALHFVRRSTHS
jgi:hypothetical protein